jgi:hypothetical protein
MNLLSPIRVLAVELRAADDVLGNGGEKIALAAEVIVERHRGHTDRVSEGSHRQGVRAIFVDKLDGGSNELLARKISPLRAGTRFSIPGCRLLRHGSLTGDRHRHREKAKRR